MTKLRLRIFWGVGGGGVKLLSVVDLLKKFYCVFFSVQKKNKKKSMYCSDVIGLRVRLAFSSHACVLKLSKFHFFFSFWNLRNFLNAFCRHFPLTRVFCNYSNLDSFSSFVFYDVWNCLSYYCVFIFCLFYLEMWNL